MKSSTDHTDHIVPLLPWHFIVSDTTELLMLKNTRCGLFILVLLVLEYAVFCDVKFISLLQTFFFLNDQQFYYGPTFCNSP